jgi:signal transduction histidine kinase
VVEALLGPVRATVVAGALPVVHADPDDMYSVLQNLVLNAVKFARPGLPRW